MVVSLIYSFETLSALRGSPSYIQTVHEVRNLNLGRVVRKTINTNPELQTDWTEDSNSLVYIRVFCCLSFAEFKISTGSDFELVNRFC